MKNLLVLSTVACLAIISCSKSSNSGTKPQILFKSYSIPAIDSSTEQFDATFQVKDGDGDIENLFYFIPVIDSDPATDTSTDYTPRQMPAIGAHKGSKVDAEVIYTLIASDFKIYDENIKPDSFHMKVFILDDAGNSSDTIITPKIPIIKN
jgi:hypothetical protein